MQNGRLLFNSLLLAFYHTGNPTIWWGWVIHTSKFYDYDGKKLLKKLRFKNFIDAAYISENQKNTETFFKINIGNNHSKIFFFENNSLKSEQNFKFGTDIIIKDITLKLCVSSVLLILNWFIVICIQSTFCVKTVLSEICSNN